MEECKQVNQLGRHCSNVQARVDSEPRLQHGTDLEYSLQVKLVRPFNESNMQSAGKNRNKTPKLLTA